MPDPYDTALELAGELLGRPLEFAAWTRRATELFIHLEAYAGAARAFDSYQVAAAVFAEDA